MELPTAEVASAADDLQNSINTPPPTGRVTIGTYRIYVMRYSELSAKMPEQFPAGKEDPAERLQVVTMAYRKEDQTYYWQIPIHLHEHCAQSLMDCKYGTIVANMSPTDFEYTTDIPPDTQIEDIIGHATMTFRDKVIQHYTAAHGAPKRLGPGPHLAQCYRLWQTPEGMLLCNRGQIAAVNTELGRVISGAITQYMSFESWITIFIPDGSGPVPGRPVTIHYGQYDEKVPHSSGHTAEEIYAGGMLTTWTDAYKIPLSTVNIIGSDAFCDSVRQCAQIFNQSPLIEKKCVISQNNAKNCLIHGRACRNRRRKLDPFAEHYHAEQCPATASAAEAKVPHK